MKPALTHCAICDALIKQKPWRGRIRKFCRKACQSKAWRNKQILAEATA